MAAPDFTTSISVTESPSQVFKAVNDVRGWWSEEIEGNTDRLDAIFDYHFSDVHRCKMKIIEFIPDQKVVWLVMENYFKFTEDKTEWTGTKIFFDITRENDLTVLKMTHQGLVPDYECYEICNKAWTQYVGQSLYDLITTGAGHPNASEKPQTDTEKEFLADKS